MASHVALLHQGKLILAEPLDELKARTFLLALTFTSRDHPEAPAAEPAARADRRGRRPAAGPLAGPRPRPRGVRRPCGPCRASSRFRSRRRVSKTSTSATCVAAVPRPRRPRRRRTWPDGALSRFRSAFSED